MPKHRVINRTRGGRYVVQDAKTKKIVANVPNRTQALRKKHKK